MARVRPSAQTMNAECQVTCPGARKTRVGSPHISLSRVKVIQQSMPNSRRSPAACLTFSWMSVMRVLHDLRGEAVELFEKGRDQDRGHGHERREEEEELVVHQAAVELAQHAAAVAS